MVIAKRGNKWCVMHCHGSERGTPIKCFSTRAEAEKMHRAIEANKSKAFTFFTDAVSYQEFGTKAEKNYYVTGYISTDEVDRQNEVVTREAMEEMLEQLKSGSIKLDVEHETFAGKAEVPIGRIVDARIDKKGLWIKALLNKAHDKFDSIWKSIKDGFLDAFSIAYKVKDVAEEFVNGQTRRLLKSLELLNVAVTGNPVNKGATMCDSFLKSANFFADSVGSLSDFSELKAADGRPPKAWWDSCVSKASKFATDKEKFCGWLYQQSGGRFGALKEAFGKSLSADEEAELVADIKTLNSLVEVKNMGEEETKEGAEKPAEENAEPKAEDVKAEDSEETVSKEEESKAESGEARQKPQETESAEKKEESGENPLDAIKSLRKENAELKAEIKRINELLNKPVLKSFIDTPVGEAAKKIESASPLDMIR